MPAGTDPPAATPGTSPIAEPPTLSEITRISARIGVLSFGGPAARIALMHREFVEERPWLTEEQFLRALSFCMLLPGPEAMQLATYAGWRLRGVPGGLIAGGLFVLPGAAIIMALALAYARIGDLPLVQALFLGVKATVVVVVLQALLRIARRALKGPLPWAIAAAAFAGLFLFDLPFPLIVLGAGAVGALLADVPQTMVPVASVPISRTLRIFGFGGALWAAPILLAVAANAPFLTELSLFFSKLAVVTFGGAYAVLAYMTQEVVQDLGWLTTAEMMDALGLAETTPGPLILVTQFVAALAGIAKGGTGLAFLAAALTLWVTFVPCFVWIFAGAPYIDWLSGRPRLTGALSAITAAVVGVIANLSVWFATHVVFADVATVTPGPFTVIVPRLGSADALAALLTALAALLLLQFRLPVPMVLAIMAATGAGAGVVAGIAA